MYVCIKKSVNILLNIVYTLEELILKTKTKVKS